MGWPAWHSRAGRRMEMGLPGEPQCVTAACPCLSVARQLTPPSQCVLFLGKPWSQREKGKNNNCISLFLSFNQRDFPITVTQSEEKLYRKQRKSQTHDVYKVLLSDPPVINKLCSSPQNRGMIRGSDTNALVLR